MTGALLVWNYEQLLVHIIDISLLSLLLCMADQYALESSSSMLAKHPAEMRAADEVLFGTAATA